VPPITVRSMTTALGLAATTAGLVLTLSGAAPDALAQPPASSSATAHASTVGPQAATRLREAWGPSALSRREIALRGQDRSSRGLARLPLAMPRPRVIGRVLAAHVGWTGGEWSCLDALWTRESGWQVHDTNGRSGAYGIPQALPAIKMARVGPDWRDNPVTQIRWGLRYIDERYGSPCIAWAHSQNHGFY
jgi:hypothetical protein